MSILNLNPFDIGWTEFILRVAVILGGSFIVFLFFMIIAKAVYDASRGIKWLFDKF